MGMQRILLVLDMDLLAVDDHFNLAPINHLITRREQEPCEVTVLSLVDSAAAEHRMNLAINATSRQSAARRRGSSATSPC